jgi:hypothetical protein
LSGGLFSLRQSRDEDKQADSLRGSDIFLTNSPVTDNLPRAGCAKHGADDTLHGLLFPVSETILYENFLQSRKIFAVNTQSQKECLYLRKIATKDSVLQNSLTAGYGR